MIYTEGWMGKRAGWSDWGWGSASSCCPLGAGPRALWGTGTPQHLPEVVWPPLPLVLRIPGAPRFQNPFLDPRPTAPGTPNPDVPVVPGAPRQLRG